MPFTLATPVAFPNRPALRLAAAVAYLLVLAMPTSLFAAAGDLDCTFGAGGIVTLDLGSADAAFHAALQDRDNIVTLGAAGGAIRLSRFLPSGALDPSFGAGGTISHPFPGLSSAGSLAIDSLSRIVVAGTISVSGDSEAFVARFTEDGAVDMTFGGGDGWTSFDWTAATASTGYDIGTQIAVDASDRPVVGGYTDANGATFNPSNRNFGVARLTTAGVLDAGFGTGGIAIASSPGTAHDDDLRAMKIDASGRIVGVGSTYYGNTTNFGPRDTIIFRWTSSGVLDTSFDGDGLLLLDMTASGGDDFGIDLDFDSSGQLVILGQDSDDPLLARLDPAGRLDTSFSGDGLLQQSFLGGQDVPEHVLVQADDKLLVTGWPLVGFNFHIAVMRFTTAGVLDTTWGGSGVVTTSVAFNERIYAALLQPNQRLLVAGGLTNDADLVMARYLSDADTLTATTTLVTSDLPDPSPAGVSVPIDASVTASSGSTSPTGSVMVTDGVDSCSLTLADAGGATATGSCLLTFSTVGSRTLTATYPRSVSFCESTGTEPHEVVQAPTSTTILSDAPDPSNIGEAVTVAYSVTSPSSIAPTGLVFVTDGVTSCSRSVADGSCNLTFVTAGTHSLTATYVGNPFFSGSTSAAEPHQVLPAATSTAILTDIPDPSVVGQAVPVFFTVTSLSPGTPTGNVTVSDGVDACTASVAAGSCSLTLSTAGARSLTATYAGDSSFAGSTSAAETHQVDPAATTTTISADAPDPSVVGQNVTVTYTVSVDAPGAGTPTGNVTVSDGVDACTASVATGSCSLTFSTVGARSLTATYAGDSSFAGSTSAAETHQVDPAATTTTISADAPDPSAVGQNVTVNYSVAVDAPGTGTPTGNVTVSDGVDSCTATVADGACSLALSTVGARSLTATYAGDSSFAGSTSAAESHQVDPASTTTAITTDTPDPSAVGQNVTVNYSVAVDAPGTGTPTGNVTVSDGTDSCTATVADGACSLALSTVGARSLTATYAGDSSFAGSTSAAESHQVDPASTTTAIITDTPDPSAVGQSVTVTFAVSVDAPGTGTPIGDVTVSDGVDSCTATVADGACNLALSTAGARSLTATYAGDSSFAGSTSAAEAHQVEPATTTIAITTDTPDPSAVGQNVTVTYAVSVDAPGTGTPTGNVTVSDGVDSCTATVADGACSLALSTVGARSLTATYAGDASFAGSTSAAEPHQVDPASTTTAIITDTPDPSAVGQNVTVTYAVSVDAPGTGTPTGNVTVSDGVDSCTASVADGACTLTLSTVGTRMLTASYSGDGSFAPSLSAGEAHEVTVATTTTTVVSHTPDPSVFGQDIAVVYSVTSMLPGVPTGDVTISDGVDACTASVADGSCTVALTTVGSRTLTVTYSGDGVFGASADAVTHTVEEAPTATTILSLSPNPVPLDSEVVVTFTVEALPPATGDPTGLVTVDDGNGNGCSASVADASCAYIASEAGQFTLTAFYSGDGSYEPSLATAAQDLVVEGAPPVAVPTLGELGLVIFALWLATAALAILRRIGS